VKAFGTRGAAADLARSLDSGATSGSHELALVAQLRQAGVALETAVAPAPDFRAALRTRLLAVATVQGATPVAEAPVARPARSRSAAGSWSGAFASRGGAVAAGAMASVVAVGGVAVASSQSLPGDPFYGVKRTAEAVQLRTADGDVERGARHLDLAATRLREVRGLTLGRDALEEGPPLGPSAAGSRVVLRSAGQPVTAGPAQDPALAERITGALDEMDARTRQGSALLTGAYRSSRSTEPLRTLSGFATRQSEGLEQLLPSLPPTAQSRARLSLALVHDVTEQAEELLGVGTCTAGCDPSQAAPTLPSDSSTRTPGSTSPEPTTGESADCGCAAADPVPAPGSSQADPAESADPTDPAEPEPTAKPAPSPSATPTRSPSPSRPQPSPSPSASPTSLLPVPVPTLPVPVPEPTLPLPSAPVSPLPLPPVPLSPLPLSPLPLDPLSLVEPAVLPQLASVPARPSADPGRALLAERETRPRRVRFVR
jgi:hypothetical protein